MSADLPDVETCTGCGYQSRWTIRGGLCLDCRHSATRTEWERDHTHLLPRWES